MKQIWNTIQIAFSAFGGFLGWFLGGADGFLYALIAFVVTDYITGRKSKMAEEKEITTEQDIPAETLENLSNNKGEE